MWNQQEGKETDGETMTGNQEAFHPMISVTSAMESAIGKYQFVFEYVFFRAKDCVDSRGRDRHRSRSPRERSRSRGKGDIDRREGRCYICKEKGHKKIDCPDNRANVYNRDKR